MTDANRFYPLESDVPTCIFRHRVIGRCADCDGYGRIWQGHRSEGVTLSWQEPCEHCSHLGYFLSDEPDQGQNEDEVVDAPF